MAPAATDAPILSPASRLAALDHCRHTPSPSRSPKRRQQFTNLELDPLLANLSPSSTLKALANTDAVSVQQEGQRSALSTSIADASTSERAFGIRAALAGKKLREWYTEVKSWYWPSTGFERSSSAESTSPLKDVDHRGYLDWALLEGGEEQLGRREELYWGSLPARVVEDLEKRIEIIRDDMETLDVEELKDHVRDAHISARSRPTSSNGSENSFSAAQVCGHLDDFTVVITATIMHALPFILRLNALLDIWSTRLLVLRQVPGWLKIMRTSQIAMEEAWLAIGRTKGSDLWAPSDLTREGFLIMKSVLEEKVSEVGQRTDTMLDMLEGGVETLPNEWIERIDDLEEDYRAWVVDAERVVDDNEWRNERDRNRIAYAPKDEKLPITCTTLDPPLERAAAVPSDQIIVEGIYESGPATLVHPQNQQLSIDEAKAQGLNSPPTNGEVLDSEKAIAPLDEAIARENIQVTQESPSISDTLKHDGTTSLVQPDSTAKNISLENADNLIEPSSEKHIRNREDEITGKTLLDVFSEPSSEVLTPMANPMEYPVFTNSEQREDRNPTTSPEYSGEESFRDPMNLNSDEIGTPLGVTQSSTRRPSPLVLNQEKVIHDSNVSTDTSYTGSPSSGYFSNMSSPEILSASRVEYFGTPIEINFPSSISREPITPIDSVSRQSSQSIQDNTSTVNQPEILHFVSSTSPYNEAAKIMPEEMTPENVAPPSFMIADSESEKESPELKRASIASFEILPIRKLHAIKVERGSSYSSTFTPERVRDKESILRQSPLPSIPDRHHSSDVKAGKVLMFPSSPTSLDGQDESPLNQAHAQRASISKSQFKSEFMSARPKFLTRSPHRLSNTSPSDRVTGLSFRMQKDKLIGRKNRERDSKPNDFKDRSKLENSEDQLEARITSILDNIPTRIKLTSAAHENTNGPQRSRGGTGSLKGDSVSPAIRLVRAQTSTPSMTRASTYSKVSDSRSPGGESDVKLYHLHQPGKDVPIKLYVRLVGEGGERVMVRVGGGWADLSEYLKEYANHHGHRSISESKFEIQGLPLGSPTTSLATLAGLSNSPMTPTSRPGTPISQPTSSTQAKKFRFSGGSPTDSRFPNTPDAPPTHRQRESTPGSAGSFTSSRRQSFHTPWAEEDVPLGLAGPKSKKTEISPRKQAWVAGMVDQARKSSAEKSPQGAGGDFGSLGNVGTTRRVFFRSSKGG